MIIVLFFVILARINFFGIIKNLLKIVFPAVLIAFLFGKPILELIEFESHLDSNSGVFFDVKGDNLSVKIPFQLPYHSAVDYSDSKDVIVYKGDFYRTTSKVFANDTLTTTFEKETPTRQNMMELMGQMSVNYDQDHSTLPIKTINNFLKNISKDYYKTQLSHVVYFWNEKLPCVNTNYRCAMQSDANLGLEGPPPRFI